MRTRTTFILTFALLLGNASCVKELNAPTSVSLSPLADSRIQAPFNIKPTTVTVSTFVGSLQQGSADGTGTTASFNKPRSLALDASGNFYMIDQINCTIRKITPLAVVTTLAGSGFPGFADGQGAKAEFSYPSGLAVDVSGYLYVADGTRIRKVSPSGLVTTFAGSGAAGSADGKGAAASFWGATDVALDVSGNVYVADFLNFKIRKISPDGMVSTFAGSGVQGTANGKGAKASFDSPNGLTVDTKGNVYVAEEITNQIRKITPHGVVTTLAGSTERGSNDGKGAKASFYYPGGMCLDASGNLYVADNGSNKIRKVTAQGDVTTVAGNGVEGFANGPAASASFNRPTDVAVDIFGYIYVADWQNNMIRKIVIR
ncbi:NHL repeat-containing protein [Mucilaginibacter sp. KACC 22773]|uniref:NHL repeat-containing protein n=1 Tax=Mucilaginibacter sp. KACC 22773 TaxID=3025671 RepID=UPI0023662A13|nr:NHL repeat-containing protein [Mucilaginibacter sp. KACC 22773]WDF81206.1 NHL repeat-containing protein [Mucilaginibacter sp. KACC 22773]